MNALLVDDHPLVLTALRSIVSRMGLPVALDGATTAAEARSKLLLAANGHAASANGHAGNANTDANAARGQPVELLLLDLRLDGSFQGPASQAVGVEPVTTDGFVLMAELRDSYPDMAIVVISGSDQPGDIVRAIDMGARGFLPKYLSESSLGEALRLVLAGGVYVPPIVWPSSADTAVSDARVGAVVPARSPSAADADLAVNEATLPASFDALRLTPRQTDVLSALLHGKTNKLIAKELGLSIETVKDHVSAVLRVLGVRTRTQAVLVVGVIAQRSGVSLEQWLSDRPTRQAP
jgi:DNA-binding NarL/FixJ family response regulator